VNGSGARCLTGAQANLSAVSEGRGKVYLVGAGPGASDLITVRGADIMRSADTIVYDFLASAEIVQMAPVAAERIYAGKMGNGAQQFEQAAINQILIQHARAGKRVVRLKGGDPFIFGRGGEEAEALAAAGIDFEVVPGVTSAIAVPAFAGIPLTHREYGSFVVFVTGHPGGEKNSAAAVPWDELAHAARGRGTIVILMATAHMRENLARLMAGGLAPETPCAAIQWGTTAAQKTVVAPIAALADEVRGAGLAAPAVVVVGECARFASTLNWAERLPLFGRRIVITRAAVDAAEFARRLRQFGAEAIEFPTIETVAPDSYLQLDSAIGRIQTFDWIVFTSATGVDAFIERLRILEVDIRAAAGARIAAIGPATAARLRHYGLKVTAVPREYRAEALIEAIGEQAIRGARILIPRAQIAREILPQLLHDKGAKEVVVAPTYKTVTPHHSDIERMRKLVYAGAIDLVTFTSSSTVNNFHAMLGVQINGLKAAVIGPITAETARTSGFNVVVSPAAYTVDSLIDAILEHFHPSVGR
jgi:uroporphyrinogen III methyltransferase / synthase